MEQDMDTNEHRSFESFICIKEMDLAARNKKLRIKLAYPESIQDNYCINLLCGPNGSGKTYVLNTIFDGLSKKNVHFDSRGYFHSKDLRIRLTQTNIQSLPNALYVGKTWQFVDQIGTTKLNAKLKEETKDHISYTFMYEQLLQHLEDNICTVEEWLESENRSEFVKDLKKDERLRTCDANSQIVQDLQQLLGGRLFFRWSKSSLSLELVLLHTIETAIPFAEWSDGQKEIFYLLLLIDREKPDILLIDEVENHLHPQYMTAVMEAIKRRVPQTIVATHHPHVIFSHYADRVIYIDLKECSFDQLPRVSFMAHTDTLREREIRILDDSFEKLSHVYKLFDHQDSQLLRQANNIAKESDLILYQELMMGLEPDVADATLKVLPDRQTGQIAEWIRGIKAKAVNEKNELVLLDIGAGIGRMQLELAKLTSWNLGKEVKWVCWEPDVKKREYLRRKLDENSITASIVDSLEEIPSGSAILSIIANVLHELSPNQFVQTIYNADDKTNPDIGEIAVLEIYPLLKAESLAVPYPEHNLISVLNEGGFSCRSVRFSLRDSSAYCVFSNRKISTEPINRDKLAVALENLLNQILNQELASFTKRQSMSGYKDFTGTIQCLTTIASIMAYKNRFWM